MVEGRGYVQRARAWKRGGKEVSYEGSQGEALGHRALHTTPYVPVSLPHHMRLRSVRGMSFRAMMSPAVSVTVKVGECGMNVEGWG